MHEQNMAILKSLCAVAWADGRVEDDEKEVIEALLQAFDANENEARMIRDYAAEPKTLDDIPLTDLDADDRRMLLQHAVFLTYVDGNQDEKEKALLQDLSGRLHIPAEERDQILSMAEDRAKRFLNLLLAAVPLLAGERIDLLEQGGGAEGLGVVGHSPRLEGAATGLWVIHRADHHDHRRGGLWRLP
jgi:tellurite resistance protein